MATKRLNCTADISVSQKYDRIYNTDDRLAVGAGAATGDEYIVYLGFDALGLSAAQYTITSATLYVTKISGAIGFNADFYARALRVTTPWTETTVSRWTNRPSTTEDGASAAVAMGTGHSGTVSMNVTTIVRDWINGQGQYGIAVQKVTAGGDKIKTLATRNTGNAAYISVEYQAREPQLTTPGNISAPGTIKPDGTSQTITWTAATDTTGNVQQSAIRYEVAVSKDGGGTWSSVGTTAAGVTSITANIAAKLGISASTYAYHPGQIVYAVTAAADFLGATYRGASGRSAAGTLDYRYPLPTAPAVAEPGTITADTVTVSWAAASDSSGLYQPSALTYQVQVQIDGDWIAAGTTAAGVTSMVINVRQLAELLDGQYAYKEIKYRVRASAPSYMGTVRTGDWGMSQAGLIDYRIRPSAPQNVSASPTQPYEGQSCTVVLGRPARYNTYSGDGTAQSLTYILMRGTEELGRATAAATSENAEITFTAGAWTDGISDTYIALSAQCVDLDGQTGESWASANAVRVRVFREPRVSIESIGRQQASATVAVRVPFTGYAGTQQAGQIASIQYSISGGASWITAATGALTATISISGITANDRYTIMVRATNTPPSGLTGKTSATAAGVITEYTPVLFVFRDQVTGKQGVGIKALVVGDDYSGTARDGMATLQKGIDVPDWQDRTILPGTLPDQSAQIYLAALDIFDAELWTVVRIKGGTGTAAAEYEIAGPAGSENVNALAFRTGKSGAWSAWKKIAFES